MSVTGVTPVTTGGVTLFVGTGSPVGPPTLATFVRLPLTGAVTINVRFVVWPFVKVPRLHVTKPKLFEPFPLALTNVTPTGNVSVTVTLLAPDGPKFVTLIV
jgi:hypothetical protein